ncbi:MAG TPA: hypothetical protein PKA15_11235 [Chitinophagales bacterium]|nr:hypothetical protein [Chitinophagales bacterium]HNI02828.1 hypothetical protein [Chitinophagales bacterium]
MKNIKVFDKYGEPKILGDYINEGGEGKIISLKKPYDHIVIKIYKEEKLNKLGNLLKNKVSSQISIKELFKNTDIAWPQLEVYNENGDWIGYAMKRAIGIPLSKLAHPNLQKKYFNDYTREDVMQVLLSIINNVKILHRNDICLGDINLDNYLIEKDLKKVYLIDTDSYQVKHNGNIFPCPVGKPEMTPLEHQDKAFTQITRNIESDLFSLGILFFQTLMRGRHPYDQIGGTNPVENLRSGNFPYGTGSIAPGQNGSIPPGPWYVIWSHLSHKVKGLFIRCFKDGVKDKSKRPTLIEWDEAFRFYLNDMKKGYFDSEIQPKEPKSKEYNKGSV